MSAIQAGKLFILQTHMHRHACPIRHIQHIHILAPALPLHARHIKTSGLTDEFYEPNSTLSSNWFPPFICNPFTPQLYFSKALSPSLLQQWYQAKNVSCVDSRHVGTRASTSASEPAPLWNLLKWGGKHCCPLESHSLLLSERRNCGH